MNKKTIVLSVVAILLVIGSAYYVASHRQGRTAGIATPSGPTSNFSWIVASFSINTPLFHFTDPTSGANALTETVTASSSVAAATSTMVWLGNPFNATSTVSNCILSGTQGATTTDIIVGTSTTPAPAGLAVATTSFKGNIFGLFAVATGTQFYSVQGATMGPGAGYTAPSSGTYPTSQSLIAVGPGEGIFAFSTSTYGGGLAGKNGATGAGLLGIPASLSLKCYWNY